MAWIAVDHPLIGRIKEYVPYLTKSGAFDELLLSVETSRETGDTWTVHLFGRYLPGRGREDVDDDFALLAEEIATDPDGAQFEDMWAEFSPTYTPREAASANTSQQMRALMLREYVTRNPGHMVRVADWAGLTDMVLLMGWMNFEAEGLTFHDLIRLYVVGQPATIS